MFLIIGISTILSCGLLTPVWVLIGLIWLISQAFTPNRTQPIMQIQQPIEAKSEYKTIFPDNSFSDDWDYVILEDI